MECRMRVNDVFFAFSGTMRSLTITGQKSRRWRQRIPLQPADSPRGRPNVERHHFALRAQLLEFLCGTDHSLSENACKHW